MKVLSKRAAVELLLILAFTSGLLFFLGSYAADAYSWAKYPANRHLYANGQLSEGTIYDRSGTLLAQTVNGKRVYNTDQTVRTAVMHAVGDSGGNVATGAQVAFAKQLCGWNPVNGAYHFGTQGNNLTLTLDANLCSVAYQALNGRKGTVGVYNYKTGEILCMTSSPSFDPENPPDISADPEKYVGVYMNRLLSATYTPGSVFKLVTAAAAIDHISDIGTRNFTCTGTLQLKDGTVTCPEAHGTVNFSQALADSCNVTFGQVAVELGSSALQQYAEKAGFNASLSVNGIKTAQGRVNLKGAAQVNLAWAGVGQYTDTANPLNYMAYVGAIANGGVRVTPRLLKNSTSAQTRVLSAGTADTLTSMMRNDVLSHYGDGNFPGLSLCAKTGTAQLAPGQASDSWFVGFLNRSDCPLAFAVVVENGGAGISAAGPVANTVLQAAVKSMTGK